MKAIDLRNAPYISNSQSPVRKAGSDFTYKFADRTPNLARRANIFKSPHERWAEPEILGYPTA
ncbi:MULTISPECIES: hypothetical protein [Oscillatoriales]|uniref:hypothetical protein n=1 Tax=Oscillatoriophycideae TaxID=1301283 RepID=UPI001681E737|nr:MULTISPECIES: hypothetical protein [Oscillatoriales]